MMNTAETKEHVDKIVNEWMTETRARFGRDGRWTDLDDHMCGVMRRLVLVRMAASDELRRASQAMVVEADQMVRFDRNPVDTVTVTGLAVNKCQAVERYERRIVELTAALDTLVALMDPAQSIC